MTIRWYTALIKLFTHMPCSLCGLSFLPKQGRVFTSGNYYRGYTNHFVCFTCRKEIR